VILLEQGPTIGGEHTWCHFATDVDAVEAGWLRPLIVHRWSGYEVRFPGHSRHLPTDYLAITSQRLHQVVSADARRRRLAVGHGVRRQSAPGDPGRRPDHRGGRGDRRPRSAQEPQPGPGLPEVRRPGRAPDRPARPDPADHHGRHGLAGGRLPLRLRAAAGRHAAADRGHPLQRRPGPGPPALRAAIAAYAKAQGWTIAKVEREEDGVLPIALGGDIDAYWREARPHIAEVGLRAALFQPTTGYSLPDAARLAETVAALPRITSASVRACVETQSKTVWRRRRFLRLLNRMLFRACAPQDRYKVLERFYRLSPGPDPTVLRRAPDPVGQGPDPDRQAARADLGGHQVHRRKLGVRRTRRMTTTPKA
jgi:lycopene beta-cyclase